MIISLLEKHKYKRLKFILLLELIHNVIFISQKNEKKIIVRED